MAVVPTPAPITIPALNTPSTGVGGVVPIPITGYANALDLTTALYAAQVIAAGGFTISPAAGLILPTLITAASREIIQHTGRLFGLTVYDEILIPEMARWEVRRPAMFRLRLRPIQSVLRVATGRVTVLTVTNTDQATNQMASVAMAVAGDVEWPDLQYVGLNLSRLASGVETVVSVDFATYPTIQAVADRINALGHGWQATVLGQGQNQPNYALLPSAALVGAREPKNSLMTGANLDAFGAIPNNYEIARSNGIGRIYYLDGFAWMGGYWNGWGGDGPDSGYGGWGWNQYRITYTAGYSTIPEPLQQVCAEVVKIMLARLAMNPNLKSETTGNFSWTARDALPTLSDASRATLNYWRDNWI